MGLPKLRPSEKEEVRKANVLLSRTAEACERIHAAGGGFSFEQPAPVRGKPTAFEAPIIRELRKATGARFAIFDQCEYGAETTKPTAVLYHRGAFCLLRKRCSHPVRDWRSPDGSTHRGAHPRLWGNRQAGGWATKRSAAYPEELCRELAKCIAVIQPPKASEALRHP